MKASIPRRRLLFAFSGVKRQRHRFCFAHFSSGRLCHVELANAGLSIHVGNLSHQIRSVSSTASPAGTPKAQYRQLGKSGLRVSVPILGAKNFGDKRWAPWVREEAEALPLLKAAFDRGINTWDTADKYSNGESERIIAKAIQLFKIPRHKLVICTKCGGSVTRENNEPDTLAIRSPERTVDYVNSHGLSRQAIFTAVSASLARLETDYIDLLQVHRYDTSVPIEETMKALHDLVESGTVRYIGACSMYAHQFASMQFCAEKHGWTKFVSMHNFYNLIYREEEREMIPFCKKTGVGLVPFGSLASGQLTQPYSEQRSRLVTGAFPDLTSADIELVDKVQEVAKRRGWQMTHVVLAWLNAKGISSPIIKFNSIVQMDEALDMRKKTLSKEDVDYLNTGYVPRALRGLP